MSKTTTVIHETRRLSPEAPECDVYSPADRGLLETRIEHGSIFISPGLGSVKADYRELATHLASDGFVVYSPNCNESLRGSGVSGALDKRAEVLTRSVESWSSGITRFVVHSLGAPVVFRALNEMGALDEQSDQNNPIESVSFMQPAGFDKHGPVDVIRATKFYFGEALPRTRRLVPSLIKEPKSVYERINIKQRWAEVQELWDLPENYMIDSVTQAQQAGIKMSFFIGPKDELTRPEPIIRAVSPIVGEHNVHEIHPEAGHLSAQTHAGHLANMIIKSLGLSQPDINVPKVA